MRPIWAICTKDGQRCSRIGQKNSIIIEGALVAKVTDVRRIWFPIFVRRSSNCHRASPCGHHAPSSQQPCPQSGARWLYLSNPSAAALASLVAPRDSRGCGHRATLSAPAQVPILSEMVTTHERTEWVEARCRDNQQQRGNQTCSWSARNELLE